MVNPPGPLHRVKIVNPGLARAQRAVAILIAKALRISLGDACFLAESGSVLPIYLAEDGARSLIEALRLAGADAESLLVHHGSSARCEAHPTLLIERPCQACGRSICRVCLGRGAGRCPDCAAREARRRRFMAMRVAVLLVALFCIVAWGFTRQRKRDWRTQWDRPLGVGVVLLATTEPSPETGLAWSEGVARLTQRLASEFARYHGDTDTPFLFQVHGPILVAAAPEFRPESDSFVDRAKHAFTLFRALRELDAKAQLPVRGLDVRLYVVLEPSPALRSGIVEGVGEAGGDVGLIRAPLGETDLTLPLTALAHEMLHCLGATDKYGPEGHALLPQGLAEPNRRPMFPQRSAEVMVGELPLGPSEGRLARSLDEVAIGPATAAEIRWVR